MHVSLWKSATAGAVVVAAACVWPLGALSVGAGPVVRMAVSRGLSPDRYEIWTMQSDGGSPRRVTRGCGWDWFPSWSPDRRRLAFTRGCNGTLALYVVNVNGSGLRRVTPTGMQAAWPTWAPDGKRLAFVGGFDRGSELYVIGVDGRALRRLTHNHVADDTPAWSPNGRAILFSSQRGAGGSHQLMLISPAGAGARALPLRGGEPAWSRDGKHIAWAQGVKGAREETDNIWIADGDGSHARQLTHERVGTASHHPTWSRDGRTLAFMSNQAAKREGASIWKINADGTGLHQLTHARFEDADPDW